MTRSPVRVAAVDLGASSGRVILGEVGEGRLRFEALARFPNEPVLLPSGLHWNLLELYSRVLGGLRQAAATGGVTSVGVDSWAVDYGLLRDGRLLGIPLHYRDQRHAAGVESVHRLVAPDELYRRNGLQFLPFNTLYQLAAEPWLDQADELLLVPDLIGFWLTGRRITERTNASTTGLIDARSRTWDTGLIDRLLLPERVFGELVDPGVTIGPLSAVVADEVGLPRAELCAVGSHDTASAVVGVPMLTDDAAYISCGTWGLVGVELERPVLTEASRAANFTNELGVDGRVRFLTNVMGLWLLSECVRAWQRDGHEATLPELLAGAADVEGSVPLLDVQDPRFAAPGDMPGRIARWCDEHDVPAPASRPILVRCIVESLAQGFADAVETAAALSGRTVKVVHLVGGGALNSLLCQAVADRSGLRVVAGPVEATALGNLLVQARAAGAIGPDLTSLRRLVAQTQDLVDYRPRARTRTSSS